MAHSLPPELSRLLAADETAREAAWAAFVAAYSKLVLHVARSSGGDHDAAMDHYAYVLEQLRRDDFQRLRTYAADGRSKFTTWLVVVARRLCLDHHRSRYGRAGRASANDGVRQTERVVRRRLTDLKGAEVDLDQLGSDAGDPEQQFRAGELRERLAMAVDQLDARTRLLLRLRFEDELSAAEIARIMGYPTPFHVYRRLNGLFGSLRRTLRASGVEDPVP